MIKVKLYHYRKQDLFLMNVKNVLHCLPTNGTDGLWFKISASLMKSMRKPLFAAAESLDRLHILLSLFEHKCAGCCVDHLDILVSFIFYILVCS